MVLATDMSKHFADISKLKSRIEAAGIYMAIQFEFLCFFVC